MMYLTPTSLHYEMSRVRGVLRDRLRDILGDALVYALEVDVHVLDSAWEPAVEIRLAYWWPAWPPARFPLTFAVMATIPEIKIRHARNNMGSLASLVLDVMEELVDAAVPEGGPFYPHSPWDPPLFETP